MKKSINLFIAFIGVYTISAQCPEPQEGEPKSSDVTTAYNAGLKVGGEENMMEAASFIDRAVKHEKNGAKSKTWRYRANIYIKMANLTPDACPDALVIAKESHLKAKELDPRGTYKKEFEDGIQNIATIAYNNGLTGYQSENFEKAARNFDMAATTKKDAGIMDSLFMFASFNAGLSYESLGNVDKAVENYERCISSGYEAKQCHYRIIAALSTADRLDESLEWIQKGKAAYPDEPEFLIQETNYHLKSKDYEKAESNLAKAIEKDPNNAMLQFVLGTAMDQLGKSDGAVEAYKKAIQIDPEYADAYYNLGASYNNKAAELTETIGDLDFRKDQAEIAKLEKEADEALKNAMPYLEKALEFEPDKVAIMKTLKSIYFQFEDMDKYNDMKARIESAQ